jgi:hypothetical protein
MLSVKDEIMEKVLWMMTLRITGNRCRKIKVAAQVMMEDFVDADGDVGIVQEATYDDIVNSIVEGKGTENCNKEEEEEYVNEEVHESCKTQF